ncbi:MAG: LacI family transcriptional regulator [Microbacteriaceae bacterium]|nr:MAG: LacI family transcriptional regulator [Microbacteriaceae bacterium]
MHTKRLRRMLTVAAAGTVLMLGAAGCSATTGSGDSGGSAKTVGATLLSLQYPFLVTLSDSMKSEAQKNDLNLITLDPRQSTATELTQVEDLITKKADAIVMIPVDQKASQAAAAKINAAKIPLVLVNTRFSDDFTGDYVSYVGSDDTEAGQIQGEYVLEQLPNAGSIVYLVGQYGGASTERRKAGFDKAIAGSDIKVATEVEAKGSRADAKRVMEDLLRRYPGKGEIVGVVAQSDEMALGAASAIKEAGRSDEFKIIIGVDGSEAGLKAVKSGDMTATVFQDAVGQGTKAMSVAADILAGKKVAKEYKIPFQLVTADNLSTFLK